MLSMKTPILLTGAAIVLGAGYFVAQQQSTGPAHVHTGPQATSSVSAPAALSGAAPHAAATAGVTTTAPSGSPNAQQLFEIRIPADTKAGIPVYRLRKDERAYFSVSSTVDGKLAVHGLTEDMPVHASQAMRFGLQAAHTGRFPMHVHGRDGSHLEVGVVEVLPQ